MGWHGCHGGLAGEFGTWERERRKTEAGGLVDAVEEEARDRRARRYSGIAHGPDQRRPRLVEQGLRDFYVGHTTLAAPGRFLSHDERMNNANHEHTNQRASHG